MDLETNENLSPQKSHDEEDVNLQNGTKPHEKETVTIDKDSYEKLLVKEALYEFITSDEYKKVLQERAKYEDKYLHLASVLGKLDIVQKLVEMGHDVNMRNKEDKTPLYLAVENNHLSIVKFLTENNAIVNIHDSVNSYFPLHIAVQNNNLSIVKHLVENDASLHSRGGPYCSTPLHLAAKKSYKEIVEYICSQKGSTHLHYTDKFGKTALCMARRNFDGYECTKIIEFAIENNKNF